jgi:glycosyltransferase involved in cell wall biosynthesis
MKVVQINSVCGVGSTGRIAVDMSQVLTANNIENYIFYGIDKSDYYLSKKIGNAANVRSHQLGTRILGYHGFYSKSATKKMLQELDAIKPNIIHLHNIHGFYINIELLFRYIKKNNIKVIWTLHDCWAFTGHCSHFDFINCYKWKKNCERCPNKQEYPKSLFFDRSKKQFFLKKEIFKGVKDLTIITPSIWLSNLVKQSFLNEYPVEVINNGIDLQIFKPTKSNFRKKYNVEDSFLILGIAVNLNKKKGSEYLIELAHKLPEDCNIIILGVTKEQQKKIPKNIISITKTNHIKELSEIYTAADVYVNPTLEDNFPTTNIESIACGTPVITFNTGGSAEIIDEKTGVFVEKENINELYNAIMLLKERNLQSEDCVKKAINCYSRADMCNKYLNIYTTKYN